MTTATLALPLLDLSRLEPLGVYSRKVKDGGTVAVPNNVTNLSRALYLLQDQKLIRLKDGFAEPDKQLATPNDIAETRST